MGPSLEPRMFKADFSFPGEGDMGRGNGLCRDAADKSLLRLRHGELCGVAGA